MNYVTVTYYYQLLQLYFKQLLSSLQGLADQPYNVLPTLGCSTITN